MTTTRPISHQGGNTWPPVLGRLGFYFQFILDLCFYRKGLVNEEVRGRWQQLINTNILTENTSLNLLLKANFCEDFLLLNQGIILAAFMTKPCF